MTPLNRPCRAASSSIGHTTTAGGGGFGSLYGGSPSTSAGLPSPPPVRSISFNGASEAMHHHHHQGGLVPPGTGKRSNSRSGFRIFCRVDCRASPQRPIPSREAVCDYFSYFGSILDCYLPESATNVAYVCFEDSQSLEDVMAQERPHVVEGTQLTVTRAQPRPDYSVNTDRIFVKHVPDSATRLDLRAYFNNFGEVTDVYIPKDKATGAQRRFAFVTFRDVRSARAALGASTHVIHDQEVQVMPAEARPQSTSTSTSMVGHSSPHTRPSPVMEPYNRTMRSQTDSMVLPASISSSTTTTTTGRRPSTPLVPLLPAPRSDGFNSIDEGCIETVPSWQYSQPTRAAEVNRNEPTDDMGDDAHMVSLATSVSHLLDSSPSSMGGGSDEEAGNHSPEKLLKESLRRTVDVEDQVRH